MSVVIPALNEGDHLPGLLDALVSQRGIRVEVIVVDGGSTDGTRAACRDRVGHRDHPIRFAQAPRGRGLQMNAGARMAESEDLLFLHADTVVEDENLLARASGHLRRERSRNPRVAGHFGLRFLGCRSGSAAAYYFYEAKTRLNRPDCVNGDQGFWLEKAFFWELGGFDESLPYMEDARLARRVSERGRWVTLPGVVGTSARRFEVEGLRERQTLNALLCDFEAIGFTEYFEEASEAYRSQETAGSRLDLGPFLRLAHRLSLRRGFVGAWRLWWKTGGYVAENAWQLAYALDCRRRRRAGLPPAGGHCPALERFDRWMAPVAVSAPGRAGAMVLTFLWFYGSLALQSFGRREGRGRMER